MKENVVISFSGGRTSGYMTKHLLDNYADKYNFTVVFANTGCEDNRTLDFVNNCDKHFGFNTVWVEAAVNPEKGKGTKHKIVDYTSASRDGKPFEEAIKKFGIPNKNFPGCTRETKLRPITSYLRSIGLMNGDYSTAIGIRTDESRRVSKNAETGNIIYPLVDLFPTDKIDVLDWWKEQEFDLGIEEHYGNCTWCWKKSLKKHIMLVNEAPEVFEFPIRMEAQYHSHGPTGTPQTFFRMGTSAKGLFEIAKLHKEQGGKLSYDIEANGGCSESCELYATE